MARPRLLLLDEPSLGIEPKIVAEIAAAINRLNRDVGMSIILVEQNARLALKLAHHAYALEHGDIVRARVRAMNCLPIRSCARLIWVFDHQ